MAAFYNVDVYSDRIPLHTVRKELPLNLAEKQYILAVERGDLAGVRHALEEAEIYFNININAKDPLGRSALLIAIQNENVEIIELLLKHNVHVGSALLHAIDEEVVEAVELLLNYKPPKKDPRAQLLAEPLENDFDPDISPVILAAHRNNYEILKILIDRGVTIPKPHDAKCGCEECRSSIRYDGLRHSRSRLNIYRALASPSLMTLCSEDPILTAFELSWELRKLSHRENEFKDEYEELAEQCREFAKQLLDQTRGSNELGTILNRDHLHETRSLSLSRLRLAIKYKQKTFTAHPNCQQLLAEQWYEGLPGWRRQHWTLKVLICFFVGMSFPLLSVMYVIAPKTELGKILRLPFLKFICHSASYLLFLLLLLFASLDIGETGKTKRNERGPAPTPIELLIVFYVMGFVWQEIKQMWDEGILEYTRDWWNLLDYVMNALYITVIGLRVTAYLNVRMNPEFGGTCYLLTENGTCYKPQVPGESMQACFSPRELWDPFDPTLTAEAVFAIANIFSMLRLVYLFIANSHLGPLQISLGRMVEDIVKFLFLITLVIFSFAAGLNQLYWVYRTDGVDGCYGLMCENQNNAFSDMFQTLQSLIWSVFGQTSIHVVKVEAEHQFTEFVGATMLCIYCIITIIVLLNLLIAMMNDSFQKIQTQADREWKFARSKLWMSYFDEGNTLPPPFNIIPSPKSFYYLFKSCCSCFGMCLPTRPSNTENRQMAWMATNVKRKENDEEYQRVMRNLSKRYLNHQRRGEAAEGVSEDDLNEIKQDISSFRYEMIELLKDKGNKKGNDKNEVTRKGSTVSNSTISNSSSFSESMNGSANKALERVPSYLMRKGRKGKKFLQSQDSTQLKPIKKAPIQDDDMSLPEFLKVRNVKNVVVAVNEMQKQSMRRRMSSTGTELARSFWASHFRQGTITEENGAEENTAESKGEDEVDSATTERIPLSDLGSTEKEQEGEKIEESSLQNQSSPPVARVAELREGERKTNEEGRDEINSANSSDNSGETSGIVSNNNSFQSQDSVDEGVDHGVDHGEPDGASLDQEVLTDGPTSPRKLAHLDPAKPPTPRDWKAKRKSFPWLTLKDSGHESEASPETKRYVYNGVKEA